MKQLVSQQGTLPDDGRRQHPKQLAKGRGLEAGLWHGLVLYVEAGDAAVASSHALPLRLGHLGVEAQQSLPEIVELFSSAGRAGGWLRSGTAFGLGPCLTFCGLQRRQ